MVKKNRFTLVGGKKKKLGVIHSKKGFTITRRISPAPRALGVEFVVRKKVKGKNRVIAVTKTFDQAMRAIDNTILAGKALKKTRKIAVKLGKGLFSFVEKSTRPRKRG